MVPLGRELVSSYRLSVQTTFVFGTVWPQDLTGCCQPPVWGSPGRDGRMWSEMCPLSSPGTTSYRLPIVTRAYRSTSHRFRSAPDVPDGQTDRRNWSSVSAAKN